MINLDQLFPDKNSKESAVAYLDQLLKTEGWKIVVKLLEEDIKRLDDELRLNEFKEISEVKERQNKRASLVILRQLPEKLIEALKEEKPDPPDFDIY